MPLPTVRVMFTNGTFKTPMIINRTDFNPAIHELHDEKKALETRFRNAIAGEGYGPAAVERIVAEYLPQYVVNPGEFKAMLMEYEQEQEDERKRDRQALDEDAEKEAETISPAEELSALEVKPETDIAAPPEIVVRKPVKMRVGQSSSGR